MFHDDVQKRNVIINFADGKAVLLDLYFLASKYEL